MPHSLKTLITQALHGIFYLSLALFLLSINWNTGWNIVGDPYSLGPYLPWLELIFPLSGLGLWGLFFAQWALGELRPIHLSRWFYLLLFVSLLMVNVLFSTNPESSLGWLSIWLSGSLVLSLQVKAVFQHKFFWIYYVTALGLSLMLWHLYPQFVNSELLVFSAWLAALHGWKQNMNGLWRYALTFGTCVLGWYLAVSLGLQLLIALMWIGLWWKEYRPYRRKSLKPWYGALASLGLFLGLVLLPEAHVSSAWLLPRDTLGASFIWWHGVGWGQLEWAQYVAQTTFQSGSDIVSHLNLGMRWWYEAGALTFVLLPSLWLLTVGHAQSLKFRTVLFWSIMVLAPSLWFSPGGVLLGCFWFFNRSSWQPPRLSPTESIPKSATIRAKPQGSSAH